MEHSFKFKDGQIYLVTNLKVWGENITEEINVTDKLRPVINDYVSYQAYEALKNHYFEK